MRLALQLQHRGSQGPFVESAGARRREQFVVALAAANTFAPVFVNWGLSKKSALPAQRIVSIKQTRCAPAGRTGDTVVTRLNAGVAHCAGLRIDERERGVVEMAQLGSGYQVDLKRKGVRKGPRRKTLCVTLRRPGRPLR